MDLAPLIVGSGIAYLIASIMMAFLYREERDAYMAWWAAAFLVSTIRQAFALGVQVLDPKPFMAAPIYFAVILSGLLLLRGTHALVGRDFPRVLYVVAAICAAYTLAAPFFTDQLFAVALPAFILRGMCDVYTGVTVLRHDRKRVAGLFTGIVFVLWGIHRFNYPLLRDVTWFAPWGFEISSVLGLSVAMGMLALHYERSRADLARREEEYRGLFENAAIGFIRTDLDGNVLDANPALVKLLGYESVDEVRRLNMSRDVYASPDAREKLLAERFEDDVLDGVELEWKHHDGQNRLVQLVTRKFEIDGEIQFEGSVRDVTAERQLRGQLNASRQMEALGRLAGGVAHDFNNMLTAIIGSVQMARLEARDGNVPEEELDHIEVAAEQAAALSRRLLAFSRRDVSEPVAMVFDMAVSNAVALLRRLIPRTVELEVQCGASGGSVDSRPGEIERLIVNLAVNANEAMQGVGTLAIHTWLEDESIVLEVRDDGAGMSEATLQRIFEPYFTTNAEQGMGLGLANVREIVDELGGDISVDSTFGKGSTFRVQVPSRAARADNSTVSSESTAPTPGIQTILLVEDTDVVRSQLTRYLERHGHRVISAADGDEGFDLGQEHLDEIDLVVTDVVMPGRTGVQLVHDLQIKRPDIAFLYMSGYTETALENEGVPQERFIAKPFKPSELQQKISVLLGISN
jgi:PAS domain S-box-containing protein